MANGSLCAFHSTNCHTKCFLVKMYCLALYGCCVWRLDSPNFSVIEIAFNRILRKIYLVLTLQLLTVSQTFLPFEILFISVSLGL